MPESDDAFRVLQQLDGRLSDLADVIARLVQKEAERRMSWVNVFTDTSPVITPIVGGVNNGRIAVVNFILSHNTAVGNPAEINFKSGSGGPGGDWGPITGNVDGADGIFIPGSAASGTLIGQGTLREPLCATKVGDDLGIQVASGGNVFGVLGYTIIETGP